MSETPDTLRELLNKLLPLDEFDFKEAEVWSKGHAHADAWEAEQDEALRIITQNNLEIVALTKRLEAADNIQKRFDRLEDILLGRVTRSGR